MSELTAEEKQRKGLRGLFRFLKRRDSEAALREAIEEFIEETETTDADQPPTGKSSLLLNILKLGEKTAYDVMTPRVDIRAAPEDIDFRRLIQLVREHGHSRVPIYRSRPRRDRRHRPHQGRAALHLRAGDLPASEDHARADVRGAVDPRARPAAADAPVARATSRWWWTSSAASTASSPSRIWSRK